MNLKNSLGRQILVFIVVLAILTLVLVSLFIPGFPPQVLHANTFCTIPSSHRLCAIFYDNGTYITEFWEGETATMTAYGKWRGTWGDANTTRIMVEYALNQYEYQNGNISGATEWECENSRYNDCFTINEKGSTLDYHFIGLV